MPDVLVAVSTPVGMPEIRPIGMKMLHYKLVRGTAEFDLEGRLLWPESRGRHYARTPNVHGGTDQTGVEGSIVR